MWREGEGKRDRQAKTAVLLEFWPIFPSGGWEAWKSRRK
jgi:hypothetical protein